MINKYVLNKKNVEFFFVMKYLRLFVDLGEVVGIVVG